MGEKIVHLTKDYVAEIGMTLMGRPRGRSRFREGDNTRGFLIPLGAVFGTPGPVLFSALGCMICTSLHFLDKREQAHVRIIADRLSHHGKLVGLDYDVGRRRGPKAV